MKTTRLFLVTAGMMIGTSGALAHPLLKSADPKPNATIAASPTHIRIGFSEGLELAFSGLELFNASGKAIATEKPGLVPDDAKELIVPIKTKLTPGMYTVKWHAVGGDTHRVSGHYNFQVKG